VLDGVMDALHAVNGGIILELPNAPAFINLNSPE
jgi:hypothetical protein